MTTSNSETINKITTCLWNLRHGPITDAPTPQQAADLKREATALLDVIEQIVHERIAQPGTTSQEQSDHAQSQRAQAQTNAYLQRVITTLEQENSQLKATVNTLRARIADLTQPLFQLPDAS